MHPAAFLYVARSLIGSDPSGAAVLEVGSYDVNSTAQNLSVRALCAKAARYHGIDTRKGPGVDEKADAADYDGKGAFDLVISTETMEHMPDPAALIACAHRALKPGGRLILTAAGAGRPPHDSDGEPLRGTEPYTNIEAAALAGWLQDWADVVIEVNEQAHDIYATAMKPAEAAPSSKRRA